MTRLQLFPPAFVWSVVSFQAGRTRKFFRYSLLIALGAMQFFMLLAAVARPAYGYIDPGSGLLFFQVGGSMLAGAVFMLRAKIRKLLRLKPPESDTISADANATSEAGK
uniref:Uncharacterized protein n=1 Tax=Paracidobacterium acidisoli TaxID=2303751 RepID=A0A372IMV6_9BACT